MEQAIRNALIHMGEVPLAVRSSGVAEDLAGASYAGQYETFLDMHGQDALLSAVRQCWASAFKFRWRSLLGVATALFLLHGAMNALAAVIVPFSLHRGGPWAVGGLVFTEQLDTAVLGQMVTTLTKTDPALSTFLVTFIDTMCAYMMAYAILELVVVWFALRRAQLWALWVATLASLAILPYYVTIAFT